MGKSDKQTFDETKTKDEEKNHKYKHIILYKVIHKPIRCENIFKRF